MTKITVVLVEQSLLFESALSNVLVHLGFLVVSGRNTQVAQAKKGAVTLFDTVTFTGKRGDFEIALKEYSRAGPVLLLAREDLIEQLVQGLRGGARGFIRQTASPKDLAKAIKMMASGGVWCDAALFQKVTRYLPALPHLNKARFTKREGEVLAHVSRGEHNREIAQELGVSEKSVKVYVSSLLRKTGASNRAELALAATGLETEEV
jgi:DNA-binding NarL/FixJ family response regulator